jgi:hypothetical protein
VIETADHEEVLAAGEMLVDGGGLAGKADHLPHGGRLARHVEAGHPRRPGVREEQRGQDPHGGGLAGAVGAEQPQHTAGRDRQVDLPQGLDVPEGLRESLGKDHRLVAHPPLPKGRVPIASVASYRSG